MKNQHHTICQRFLNGGNATQQQLTCLQFTNLEDDNQQTGDEMIYFNQLKDGDQTALKHIQEVFEHGQHLLLSDEELSTYQLLFMKHVTLVKLAAVQAGVENQLADTINTYYIHQMIKKTSIDEIIQLHQEMIAYFYEQIVSYQSKSSYPKDIQKVLHYIDQHLHQKIILNELAELINYSPNYFSQVFKSHMNLTVTDYINQRKMKVAKNMLLYSDFTITDISNYLGYSSESYFIKIFKKVTGTTPKSFRAN